MLFGIALSIMTANVESSEMQEMPPLISTLGSIDLGSSYVVIYSVTGLMSASLGGWIARTLARGGPFDPSPPTPG